MKLVNLTALLRYLLIISISSFIFSPAFAYADTTSSGTPDQSLPLGSIVHQQTTSLPSDLQSIATGKEIVYVTSDVNNKRVFASGLIITPNSRPSHPNIVTWSHAFSGLANKCAPSENFNYFYPEAIAAVKSYLQQGWTVAATDYQGLGAAGPYEAFIGNTEAKSVIDSVRAARNLDSTLTNNWVASGHSGGGASPLFTGEIANSYSQDLNLKGVVSMAPISNVDLLFSQTAGTPAQGYIPVALTGLSDVDSTVNTHNLLAQPAVNLLSELNSGCVFDILGAYSNLTPNQLLLGGQLPNSIISELGHYDNPGQQKSSAPIFLLQGNADQEIPPFLTGLLQNEVCSQGSTSFVQYFDGVGHDDLPVVTTGLVSSYISDRFNNVTPPSNCQ